nr:glycoside hydrolase family 44 protein [Armatimonadota bacterium]
MRTKSCAIAIAVLVFAIGGSAAAWAQDTAPKLTVDVTADRHPISPDIYGMAYPDPVLAAEIHLPMNRWGGDATTRYNWLIDRTNSGDDCYFISFGSDQSVPSGGPDELVARAKADGGRVLLTIPIIDYLDKAVATDCTFPVSIFGPQQKVFPYVHPIVDGKATDAGNGRTPDGKPITPTPDQILRVHVSNTPEIQRGWVEHLVQKFGKAADGGVPFYEMDNEPDGWNNTHRDIHPGKTGHDELVNATLKYAAAVKDADPTAQVLGPGGFLLHYQNDGAPGDGKTEHGGLGQATYYLQQ